VMLDVVDEAQLRVESTHAAWSERFNEMFAPVAGVFENVRSRKRGRAYVLGLLSHAERKNGWSLAQFAGDLTPHGMQRLLNFYSWDADEVRDLVRSYVVRHLGDPGAVLVADETGFLKKGKMSAGWPGSTPGWRAGSRTRRSESSWHMRPRTGRGR
jgi:SRSO17 transposase